ncbi:hypothetical protein LDENG_00235370 [Lucifuga dentata]|nr:hypothetical protein LDENG_00235370 [Lucifuga dentata]
MMQTPPSAPWGKPCVCVCVFGTAVSYRRWIRGVGDRHLLCLLYVCYTFVIRLLCLLYVCYTFAIRLLYVCFVISLLYVCYTFVIHLFCYTFAIRLLYICFVIRLLYVCYTFVLLYVCYTFVTGVGCRRCLKWPTTTSQDVDVS